MLGECFSRLTVEQQQVILNWIEKGPNLENFKQFYKQHTGREPTDEDITRDRNRWQRDRLAWFKGQLPGKWKKQYEVMVEKYGEPEHPEFTSYSSGLKGVTSPKSTGELQSMSIPDIVEFLKSWKPPDNSMTHSQEALGQVLSFVISQAPERFANEAMAFKGVDPTYVRALFTGLCDAFKQNQTFEWPFVLGLSQ